jgi:hypothetical protein
MAGRQGSISLSFGLVTKLTVAGVCVCVCVCVCVYTCMHAEAWPKSRDGCKLRELYKDGPMSVCACTCVCARARAHGHMKIETRSQEYCSETSV